MKRILLAVAVLLAVQYAGYAQGPEMVPAAPEMMPATMPAMAPAMAPATMPAAAPAKTGGLQMVNLRDLREFDTKDMLKKNPLATNKLVFNTYYFAPGQVLKLHKHPATDELFYITEGRGQFTVGDTQVMVDGGSVVYAPANVPHGLVNSGDLGLVMTSVQAPKPVKMTYVEHAGTKCAVCGQENIIPAGAKAGDIITCPRCQSKLKLSKDTEGNWVTTQL